MTRNQKIEQLQHTNEVLEGVQGTLEEYVLATHKYNNPELRALANASLTHGLAILNVSKAVIKLMEVCDDE